MIDEDLADYALTCTAGASYAEARIEEATESSIMMSNGQVEGGEVNRQQGISIRVLVDGGMGFAATNILTRQAVGEMAARAVRDARRQHSRHPLHVPLKPVA